MKTIQRLVASVVVAAVFGFALQAMAQAGPGQLTAKVVRLSGDARYSNDGQSWHIVKAGDVLRQGAVIQTGEKSWVDLILGETYGAGGGPRPINFNTSAGGGAGMYNPEEKTANVVRVFESSVLAIDKLTSEASSSGDVEETQLDLRAGRVMGNVKKLSSSSKYEIKVPNGVAGIRGTVYLISSAGVVDVLTGSVVIAVVAPDGSVVTKVVSAGNQWDPATQQITPIPGPVLALINDTLPDLSPQTGISPGVPTANGPIVYVSPVNAGDPGAK